VAAGRQRRREVAGGRPCHRGVDALAWVRTERDTRPWAGVDGLVTSGLNRRRAAVGRARFNAEMISHYSNYLQTLKYKMKAILMFKNIQTWHGGIVEHSEQPFPLGRLLVPNRIRVTNFKTNSPLSFSSNFKRIHTFLKNSDKFLKILS
jgi:hypothetical protein